MLFQRLDYATSLTISTGFEMWSERSSDPDCPTVAPTLGQVIGDFRMDSDHSNNDNNNRR
jgi:hypothetical protein